MKKILTYVMCAFLFVGCVSPKGDLPNFRVVDQYVYRGGQPTDIGFERLISMGITNSVKLNGKPSNDNYMNTTWVPISLWSQLWPWGVSDKQIRIAISHIKQGTIIHCKNGWDRTGLVCAIYRVEHDGWTCDQAETEMINGKFHKSLFGLWCYWKHFKKAYATQ